MIIIIEDLVSIWKLKCFVVCPCLKSFHVYFGLFQAEHGRCVCGVKCFKRLIYLSINICPNRE